MSSLSCLSTKLHATDMDSKKVPLKFVIKRNPTKFRKLSGKYRSLFSQALSTIYCFKRSSSCADNQTAYYVLDIESLYRWFQAGVTAIVVPKKNCTWEIIFVEVYPTRVTTYVY